MDPAELRAAIPATERCAHFNTGASGPTPRPVVEAATDFLERHAYEGPTADPYEMAWDAIEAARETVAVHVGATPERIAFTRSTADGINLLAAALDLGAGDVVVRTDLEHPANTLPWARLADLRGIEVRVVETTAGRLDMAELRAAVADADLVALSSLTWSHGTRLPVGEVVDLTHDAGARVLVDAVQSLGQHPVDVTEWGADFVVGAGHKWLLSVWGGGLLYVAPGTERDLSPARIGYRGAEVHGTPAAVDYEYRPGALGFEVGTTSPAPYVALAEAVETIEAVGYDAIRDRVERLTDRLKAGLGDRLLSPREYESGLVTFAADDPEATVERLREAGVVVRSIPNPQAVRASVHAFNTAAEVEALLDAL